MKALLAITNHNIDFCLTALKGAKNLPLVSVLALDDRVPKPTKDAHVLLIPTAATAMRNARVLNECPNIVVIVFDAPVLAKELGAQLLDVEKQTLDYVFRYHHLEPRDVIYAVRKSLSNEGGALLTKKKINMSTKLLKRVYGSIIGKFLTFMYKIPDTNKRTEVQKQLFDAWWDNDVPRLVEFINTRYPKHAAAKEFLADLQTPDGVNFATAVVKLRALKEAGKPIAYAKLSKDHGVSAFDLRYYAKGRK